MQATFKGTNDNAINASEVPYEYKMYFKLLFLYKL